MANTPFAFTIGGFRSFRDRQRLSNLSKINLLIGKNNSGKSNVLRFLHEVLPSIGESGEIKTNKLDVHLREDGKSNPIICGFGMPVPKREQADWGVLEEVRQKAGPFQGTLEEILLCRAKNDDNELLWFDYIGLKKKFDIEPWESAVRSVPSDNLYRLWSAITKQQKGSLNQHWVPETLNAIIPNFKSFTVELIPAIRKIGGKGSESTDFSGDGIIERLARLQNPDALNQRDRTLFERINRFVRYVTENDSATIEIPHDRETINVHMDGLVFPLESMGTGIHEVVILATASTVLEDTLICMEEPEIHLNPILQKKLVQYLLTNTSNQYFIATHSAALMDCRETSVFHISSAAGFSEVLHAISPARKSVVCDDLGYKASDLLQTNCIIWVEGPSDRIYVKHWMGLAGSGYTEGLEYSIMFYGGRLSAHISGLDSCDIVEEFISLRRLNRKSVILIDSDKESVQSRLNETKKRLVEEFGHGPGFAWVTEGRTIENYVDPTLLKEAISATYPSAAAISDFEKFSECLRVKTKKGILSTPSKVAVAKWVTGSGVVRIDRFDLRSKIEALVEFIRKSNA